jgi:hypothetical protein
VQRWEANADCNATNSTSSADDVSFFAFGG